MKLKIKNLKMMQRIANFESFRYSTKSSKTSTKLFPLNATIAQSNVFPNNSKPSENWISVFFN